MAELPARIYALVCAMLAASSSMHCNELGQRFIQVLHECAFQSTPWKDGDESQRNRRLDELDCRRFRWLRIDGNVVACLQQEQFNTLPKGN